MLALLLLVGYVLEQLPPGALEVRRELLDGGNVDSLDPFRRHDAICDRRAQSDSSCQLIRVLDTRRLGAAGHVPTHHALIVAYNPGVDKPVKVAYNCSVQLYKGETLHAP